MTVVRTEAALAAAWPDWAALWRQVPGAPPFLAPAWLAPWWTVFGTGAPAVALLHGPGGLAGVLPLYRLAEKLLPMGVGVSDYFDALLAPEAPADAAGLLLAAALAAHPGLRCDLPELPPGARLLSAAAPPGWRRQDWPGPPCPVLKLAPAPAIPRSMRRNIHLARNRAARAGGFEIARANAPTLAAHLDVLVRLHTGRWQSRSEAGVLSDPLVTAFHARAAPALLAAGLLRLDCLSLRGRPAAAIYALVSGATIYFYLSGFDAAFGFESPGTILFSHMVQEAAVEGRREAHFLRGGESYKYAWGAADRVNAGLSFLP